MSPEAETVLHDALALPSDARAAVAAELLASLEGPSFDDPVEVEAAWAKEIERRAQRALSGEDPGEPWEDVAARVRANSVREARRPVRDQGCHRA